MFCAKIFGLLYMKTFSNLYSQLCSYENLFLAFCKASKGRKKRAYVTEFGSKLHENLLDLQWELFTRTYAPMPLKSFVIRDPKTRKISKSHFRDRVVHHALCNVIEPVFEPRFIFDSYANRKGKGTSAALKRFEHFLRKVTRNGRTVFGSDNSNFVIGFALKADIKHYFERVDHKILLSILAKMIADKQVIWLAGIILGNFSSLEEGKGMPLGNLTSQFFANVYLNELDYFVKHNLKAKYYLRYVDDFVILSKDMDYLEFCRLKIGAFLLNHLKLELHPQKSKIIPLSRGVSFLGLRIFYNFKLLKKSNLRKLEKRIQKFQVELKEGAISYENIEQSFLGWGGYAASADTFRLRKKLAKKFPEFAGYFS